VKTNPSVHTAVKYLLLLSLTLLICGCASAEKDEKPKRDSDRRWYQGTMDTQERTFFIDSFFDGR
jgi:uncharacterized protein YceK